MKTINFKIIYNENEDIYQVGYVEVPDDIEEESDWFYYDQNGFAQPRVFTHHEGVELTATPEQIAEIEKFNEIIYVDEVDWVNDVILTAEEDENHTYVRNDITIIVNKGAEFELEYSDYHSKDWDSDYYMAFTPKFNGEKITLGSEVIFEDPYTYDEFEVGKDILYEKGAYIVEIPKEWWEDSDNQEIRTQIIEHYTDAFEQAYRKTLAYDVGVFGISSNMYEEKLKAENDIKVFDQAHIQDFGNAWEDSYVDDEDLWVLYNLTSEDVENAVKGEWKEQEEYYKGYE